MALDEQALAYRQAYHDQVRGRKPADPGESTVVEEVGPVVRVHGAGQAFLTYRDLGGLDGEALDAFIAEQYTFFTSLGVRAEWKYYDYDEPADLADRLAKAGFQAEEVEAILVGEASKQAVDVRLPDGVTIREVAEPADFERIVAFQDVIWGEDHSWLLKRLESSIVNVVAESADGEVVSAAWLRGTPGTEFAGLWGGSTLEQWRGKGIYRALVAYRAKVAVDRGYRYLHVDASPDSAPILRRLGLVQIASSIPYVVTPG
ncbi:GNAT family N-acetyltransferase [Flindersiella endophytica]